MSRAGWSGGGGGGGSAEGPNVKVGTDGYRHAPQPAGSPSLVLDFLTRRGSTAGSAAAEAPPPQSPAARQSRLGQSAAARLAPATRDEPPPRKISEVFVGINPIVALEKQLLNMLGNLV